MCDVDSPSFERGRKIPGMKTNEKFKSYNGNGKSSALIYELDTRMSPKKKNGGRKEGMGYRFQSA